jgi:two-component system, OmpR family, phosphate regulon sensor histidine kinase PhoR
MPPTRLKTPLTAMRGFAETLLDGDPPEPLRREFLESIRTNTLRLQNLVDDLLDLSRLEAGAWRIQEEEVEVAASASEVWRELMQQHRERSVTFAVQGDAVALADAQALHQVFRNLMDNALRYTPDGGRIEVTITPTGPTLSVTVTDSGAGIPSSALPRIFERFYRVDPGRDRAAGGTGLGLAIVRHLVHSMGGEVGAESELGEGTTIRFTLPRVE